MPWKAKAAVPEFWTNTGYLKATPNRELFDVVRELRQVPDWLPLTSSEEYDDFMQDDSFIAFTNFASPCAYTQTAGRRLTP